MTDTGQNAPSSNQGLRRFMPKTVNGKCLLVSFVFCVVSSIFMAGIIPAENWFGAVGTASIYFVIMIMLSAIIRMIFGRFMSGSSPNEAGGA